MAAYRAAPQPLKVGGRHRPRAAPGGEEGDDHPADGHELREARQMNPPSQHTGQVPEIEPFNREDALIRMTTRMIKMASARRP